MEIAFGCGKCGHVHCVDDGLRGTKLACLSCGQNMVVPTLAGITPPARRSASAESPALSPLGQSAGNGAELVPKHSPPTSASNGSGARTGNLHPGLTPLPPHPAVEAASTGAPDLDRDEFLDELAELPNPMSAPQVMGFASPQTTVPQPMLQPAYHQQSGYSVSTQPSVSHRTTPKMGVVSNAGGYQLEAVGPQDSAPRRPKPTRLHHSSSATLREPSGRSRSSGFSWGWSTYFGILTTGKGVMCLLAAATGKPESVFERYGTDYESGAIFIAVLGVVLVSVGLCCLFGDES